MALIVVPWCLLLRAGSTTVGISCHTAELRDFRSQDLARLWDIADGKVAERIRNDSAVVDFCFTLLTRFPSQAIRAARKSILSDIV